MSIDSKAPGFQEESTSPGAGSTSPDSKLGKFVAKFEGDHPALDPSDPKYVALMNERNQEFIKEARGEGLIEDANPKV